MAPGWAHEKVNAGEAWLVRPDGPSSTRPVTPLSIVQVASAGIAVLPAMSTAVTSNVCVPFSSGPWKLRLPSEQSAGTPSTVHRSVAWRSSVDTAKGTSS